MVRHHMSATCPALFARRPGGFWLATICGYHDTLFAVDADGTASTSGTFPYQIAAIGSTPDGRLWVATNHELFAVDAEGRVERHIKLPARTWIADVTAAPDGSAWFVDTAADKLGQAQRDGRTSWHALPGAPQSVTVDSRGCVLVMFADRVAAWSPSGLHTVATVMGQIDLSGRFLVPARDGSVWVVGLCGTVARIDAHNRTQLITLPAASCPVDIAPDASGGAWLVDNNPDVLVHIAPTGELTPYSAGQGQLAGVFVDQRDHVWFADPSTGEIVSVTEHP